MSVNGAVVYYIIVYVSLHLRRDLSTARAEYRTNRSVTAALAHIAVSVSQSGVLRVTRTRTESSGHTHGKTMFSRTVINK